MDAETQQRINASRARLRALISEASEDDLSASIDGDWTISAMLAHLAFTDRRTSQVLRRYQTGDSRRFEIDFDVVNDAALYQWRLIPPRAAAQEALDAAEEVDALVAGLSDDTIAAIQQADLNIRYDRSTHRNAHLDQIERALG